MAAVVFAIRIGDGDAAHAVGRLLADRVSSPDVVIFSINKKGSVALEYGGTSP